MLRSDPLRKSIEEDNGETLGSGRLSMAGGGGKGGGGGWNGREMTFVL